MLPIQDYVNQILDTAFGNLVTIISAETGAGKSTQVPQMLLDQGYNVIVTQPRRLAARSVAQRVATERGEQLGDIVGFHTAHDYKQSDNTQCLFVTDGLEMVRQLVGYGHKQETVLIIDEVHEWNLNIEVLLAWIRLLQKEGELDFKVVLMSATLGQEKEALSQFFFEAPIIDVPGRTFPVEEQKAGDSLIDDVERLVREEKNTLVFQPGKREIYEFCQALEARLEAEIIPLHGELSSQEQNRVFEQYPIPKVVVATNVAETSITIDDIHAVVDSGLERTVVVQNGVESLVTRPVSRQQSLQRKGRAGRTQEGIYIDHCAEDRSEHPLAEIYRKLLDQTVLRLKVAHLEMEELEFFHQPDLEEIRSARQSLCLLGAIDEQGEVTEIGRLMNRMPISVQFSRMVVEAMRRNCLEEVIRIAAICNQGGIVLPGVSQETSWKDFVTETSKSSDLLAQLDVWNAVIKQGIPKKQLKEFRISAKDFQRAKATEKKIRKAVRPFTEEITSGNTDDVMKSVCAGLVDSVYQKGKTRRHSRQYIKNDKKAVYRDVAFTSVFKYFSKKMPEWVVGVPLNINGKPLLNLVTAIDPQWFIEVAPQLIHWEKGQSWYDRTSDQVLTEWKARYQGHVLQTVQEQEYDIEVTSRKIAFSLNQWKYLPQEVEGFLDSEYCEVLNEVLRENYEEKILRLQLSRRTTLPQIDFYQHILNVVKEQEAACLGDLVFPEDVAVPRLTEQEIADIKKQYPDYVQIGGNDFEVHYPDKSLTLSVDDAWLSIPDEGVFLPSGDQVKVTVRDKSMYLSHTDGKRLKEEIRIELNRDQWPYAQVPKISQDEDGICEYVYGTCCMTGQDLVAYGCIDKSGEGFWSPDYSEVAQRLRDRHTAEQKAEVRHYKERFKELRAHEDWSLLDSDTKNTVLKYMRISIPCDLEDLTSLVSKMDTYLQKVYQYLDDLRLEHEQEQEDREELASLQEIYGVSTYIFVTEDGDCYVYYGELTTTGYAEIQGALRGPEDIGVAPKNRQKSQWVEIVGQKIGATYFSSRGKETNRVFIILPQEVTPGLWAVAQDQEVIYTHIFYQDDKESVPEVDVIQLENVDEENTKEVADSSELQKLAQKFNQK